MTRYEPSSSVRGSDMKSVNEAKKQKVASYASEFDALTSCYESICILFAMLLVSFIHNRCYDGIFRCASISWIYVGDSVSDLVINVFEI